MDDTQLEIFEFTGNQDGPHLAVFGAVHGNEKCGPEALKRILGFINDGKIKIKRGKVTFIPICNPRAYAQNVRFTERNLNRFMYPKDDPQAYEDHLDNQICPILEQADYLLDIHSYTTQGGSFCIVGEVDQRNIDFAKSLGIPRFIHGWADALSGSDDLEDQRQAIGTTEYIRNHSGVGLTLECGNHNHPRGADTAFQATLNALRFLGMADIEEGLDITDLPDDGEYCIKMQGAYLKMRDGDFTQDFKNMDHVTAGSIVARYDDGEEISMPADGFIVLPKRDTGFGHEWFFWGIEDSFDD